MTPTLNAYSPPFVCQQPQLTVMQTVKGSYHNLAALAEGGPQAPSMTQSRAGRMRDDGGAKDSAAAETSFSSSQLQRPDR